MHFPTTTTTLVLTLLTSLTTASPTLSPRQGGFFTAVGNKFSGPGCASQSLIFADPIFGTGNACQPLDRSGTGVPILSYETTQTTADCKGTLVFQWGFWGGDGWMDGWGDGGGKGKRGLTINSSGYLHDDGLLGDGVPGAGWGMCNCECGV